MNNARPARGAAELPQPPNQPMSLRVSDIPFAIALVTYGLVVVRTAWLCDDAYITFRTVDNFANGYGLRWNIAERVQAFTHPLWMLLISLFYSVTREIYLTSMILSLVLSLAAVCLVFARARRTDRNPWAMAAVLSILWLSRAFVDYSTSGLENPLTNLLLVLFALPFLQPEEGNTRRIFHLGLIAGLLALNRLDTVLLILPALAWELYRRPTRAYFAKVALGFLPFGLWEVFAITYYGFPFPNTAYAKLQAGIGRLDYWQHGLSYFENAIRWDPITLLAISAILVLGLLAREGRRSSLLAGVGLYLLYVFNIGGDFMAGRYFAAPLLVCVIVAAGMIAETPLGQWALVLPVLIVALGCVGKTPTILSGSDYNAWSEGLLDESGIADERGYYYPATGLLSPSELAERPSLATAQKGRRARRNHDPLIVDGSVGFVGYFAGPDTYVIDYHALGDPLLARLPMVKNDPLLEQFCLQFRGMKCATTHRIGHLLRNIPHGYIESSLSGENKVVDDDLRRLYETVRTITRGPIWSAERWLSIVRLNLGIRDNAPSDSQPAYQPIPYIEAYETYPETRSASVLIGAAEEYTSRGDSQRAIACYRKRLAIDDSDSAVWNNMGMVLWSSGEKDAAQDAFKKSNTAESEFNLGQAMIQLGNTQNAKTHLEQAIRMRPNYAQAHHDLGIVLAQSGELENAITHFRLAVRYNPNFVDAHNNLGVVLSQIGHLQEAIEQFEEVLRQNPNDENAQKNLDAVRVVLPKEPPAIK